MWTQFSITHFTFPLRCNMRHSLQQSFFVVLLSKHDEVSNCYQMLFRAVSALDTLSALQSSQRFFAVAPINYSFLAQSLDQINVPK